MNSALKRIEYRGGIASFFIPESWVEEYEPEGGATFYEPRDDSGTLRLNVMGFSSENEAAIETAVAGLDGTRSHTDDGFLLLYEVCETVEDGQPLEIHRWQVAIPVTASSMRLAIFSHTILAGQQKDPRIAEELKLVGAVVRGASFSTAPGVSGDYYHGKVSLDS